MSERKPAGRSSRVGLEIALELVLIMFGEQRPRHRELLHFFPIFKSLVSSLKGDHIGVLRGDLVKPLERLADVFAMAVGLVLLLAQLLQSYDSSAG
jgi:hypothetical protein